MKVGFENDIKLVTKFENMYAGCINATVNEYIQKLKPIKERIIEQIKRIQNSCASTDHRDGNVTIFGLVNTMKRSLLLERHDVMLI